MWAKYILFCLNIFYAWFVNSFRKIAFSRRMKMIKDTVYYCSGCPQWHFYSLSAFSFLSFSTRKNKLVSVSKYKLFSFFCVTHTIKFSALLFPFLRLPRLYWQHTVRGDCNWRCVFILISYKNIFINYISTIVFYLHLCRFLIIKKLPFDGRYKTYCF